LHDSDQWLKPAGYQSRQRIDQSLFMLPWLISLRFFFTLIESGFQ